MSVNSEEKNELVLTEREIAIASGADPDSLDTSSSNDEEGSVVGAGDVGGDDFADDSNVGQNVAKSEGGTDAASSDVLDEEDSKDGNEENDTKVKTWHSDDDVRLAAAYNIDPEELASFGSRDEFLRAAILFDKKLLAEAAAIKESENTVSTVKIGETEKNTEKTRDSIEKIDPTKYSAEEYGPDTVNLVKQLRFMQDRQEAYEVALKQAEEFQKQVQVSFQEHQHRQKLESFHDAVDQMDVSRYGRSIDDNGNYVPLDKSVDDNRRKLFDTVEMLSNAIVQTAVRSKTTPVVPPLTVLLRRAEQVAFGKEIADRDKKEFEGRLKAQAKRRRSAGSASGISSMQNKASMNTQGKSNAEAGSAASIANNPTIVAGWNRITEG